MKRADRVDADTLEDLRREIAESEAFLGGAITSEDLDESPTEVGGCAGVRFRAGARGRLLDLRAVSYRGTLFLFSVVAPEEEMTELVSALERLAASVTFPVLRWEPAR